MTDKQPRALVLAALLSDSQPTVYRKHASQAAAELRRLHQERTETEALLRQALGALEEERRIRLIGQSPECGQVHWESMRDMRRSAYASTDAAITAIKERLNGAS